MNQLKQIHAYTLRNGVNHSETLFVRLLQIPDIHYARKVFDEIPKPKLSLYNKLIHAYFSSSLPSHCFSLYTQLRLRVISPNPTTFTWLFAACTSVLFRSLGKSLHAQLIKFGLEYDVYALTALVDMYAKMGLVSFARKQFDHMKFRDVPTWNSMISGYARCGDMEDARELFGLMPSRNVISWTSMISGYAQNGQYQNALKMFLLMEEERELKPNEVTIASVLPACANLGALEVGQRIDEYARRNGYLNNMYVCNGLLEMYAKCGKLDVARELFDEIGRKRNLCSWNSMIMGLAIHGRCEEALALFHDMLGEGLRPDDVTFVGVLLACTHGGMVQKGQEIFESMRRDFGIAPKIEHHGCMVDLLGRAGKLNEAYDVIQRMPMRPDSVLWGALLGACSLHRNIDVAEKAAEALFELEPWNPGNYVIMCNIYASAKRWDGVARVRKMMKGSKITKAAGHSCIEEGGEVHKFIVEDKSHPRSSDIYELLEHLYTKMKKNVGSEIDSNIWYW